MSAEPAYDLFLAMRRRRMHRLFLPHAVDPELIERLVYAAGRAPLVRADMRHLVVVTDPRLMRAIRVVCPGFVNNAPALIAVCGDVGLATELLGERAAVSTCTMDCGAAVGYLSLAAPALGLGICTVTSWTHEAVRPVLGLPEHILPVALVAVGHPVPDPPKAPPRFHPIVHFNRFGTADQGE